MLRKLLSFIIFFFLRLFVLENLNYSAVVFDLMHDLFSSYLEPINGTAIDERWKFTQSVTEGISNRTHGQHNMELITNSLDKEVK